MQILTSEKDYSLLWKLKGNQFPKCVAMRGLEKIITVGKKRG